MITKLKNVAKRFEFLTIEYKKPININSKWQFLVTAHQNHTVKASSFVVHKYFDIKQCDTNKKINRARENSSLRRLESSAAKDIFHFEGGHGYNQRHTSVFTNQSAEQLLHTAGFTCLGAPGQNLALILLIFPSCHLHLALSTLHILLCPPCTHQEQHSTPSHGLGEVMPSA